jgi:hypothetical protein
MLVLRGCLQMCFFHLRFACKLTVRFYVLTGEATSDTKSLTKPYCDLYASCTLNRWCKPPKNFVTECRLRNQIFQRIAHAIEKGSSSALSVDTSTWDYGDGDQSQLKESREANIVDYIWGELEGGDNETTHVRGVENVILLGVCEIPF